MSKPNPSTNTDPKPPKDCSYPKNCGWEGVGCRNLLCKHMSQQAARDAAFFLGLKK